VKDVKPSPGLDERGQLRSACSVPSRCTILPGDLSERNDAGLAGGGNLGIERFITTTRRENFLVPPRRRRAFPLVELD
jgi:hypothetical protein